MTRLRSCDSETKKADVVEHPKVLHRVGLLANEPPGTGRIALYLVVRNFDQSQDTVTTPDSRGLRSQFLCYINYRGARVGHKPDLPLIAICYNKSWPMPATIAGILSGGLADRHCTGRPRIGGTFELPLKTQGELESAISEGISRFEHDYMGRGPKGVHAYLIADLLVVRLRGVLTVAEQQLATSLTPDKGRDLVKQVRVHLMETARSVMEAMVEKVTGRKVVSLHHDISTTTGEEVVLFTLAKWPRFRETSN